MNHPNLFACLFLVITLSFSAVYAEENQWQADGELSFVKTGGNSDVSTFAAKNLLKYKFSKTVEGTWKVAALSSKSDGIRSAENYLSELRGDFLFSERIFAGLSLGWLKDTFSGVDARYAIGPVLGYKMLIGPEHFLKTETGLDAVREENTNGSESDFFRAQAFGEYAYHFTKINQFLQSIEYLYDFDNENNYNINTETAMVTVLNAHFSLKTRYVIKYDNEPTPATLEKTDSILAVSVLISF